MALKVQTHRLPLQYQPQTQIIEGQRPGDSRIDGEAPSQDVSWGRASGGRYALCVDRNVMHETVGSAILLGSFHVAGRVAIERS